MDTPQKAQIAAPRAKFEGSPVFNYINSLSPIKPVKSIHVTQTFQSLSFSSLPSIFNSPHVSSQMESRFLRRHSISDPSKPEFSSENGNTGDALGVAQMYDNSSELQENHASVVPHSEHVNFATELPQKLNYDCGSPENGQTPRCGPQIDCGLEVSGKPLPEGETNVNGIYQTEQSKEATESDWENLITDSSDLLIFNSPIDTNAFKELMEGSMDCHDGHEMPMEHTGSKEMVASNLNRGMLRRCLDFEGVGTHKNFSGDSSESKDKKLIPGGDSSRRVLPGIGLHLNALALNSKNCNNFEVEVMSSEIRSSPVASFQSPNIGQELNESLTLASEQDIDPTGNSVALVEDVFQTATSLISEEFSNNSPKKKRCKLEGETEGCKRCNCKKSKCLKLYCECFAAGVYCIDSCSCQECFNKPTHEDTVLATRKQIESRNPLAFAPKVIRGSESVAEISDDSNKTPASARHKRGCNCKKSNCLKKYCECYQGGVGCSVNCRCEGCKNVFGRKDGIGPPEPEETGEEVNGAENVSQKPELSNIEEENLSSTPQTPLSLCRPLLRLPFSAKGKPPRSSLGIGSSSGTYTNQKYSKPNILRPEHKFEKQLQTIQTIPDDEIPEILTKTSPNRKRVSPPQSIIRNGRKVILRSIPSFPSLNTHQ